MNKKFLPAIAMIVASSLLTSPIAAASAALGKKSEPTVAERSVGVKSSLLAKYAFNLTELAQANRETGANDYQAEIEKAVRALSKIGKSPILLHQDQAARMQIISGLAARARNKNTDEENPNERAKFRTVWQLNVGEMGDKNETAAQQVEAVLREAATERAVLFIDELPALLETGDELARVLTDAVKSGKVQFVSASNDQTFNDFVERNTQLETLFQPIKVESKDQEDEQEVKGDRISPDLRQLMQSGKADDLATVILKSRDIQNPELRQLLADNGVQITDELPNLDMLTVKIPLKAVEAVMTSRYASSISLDRETEAMSYEIDRGHLARTSGASMSRQVTSSSFTGLFGTGIGIAIFDSSIANAHHSFVDGYGTKRLIGGTGERDFTGEGMETNDRYGHGTHVASIAAGIAGKYGDDNSNDALKNYNGVAMGAKIFNYRVLNGSGRGTTAGLIAALDAVLTHNAQSNPEGGKIHIINLSLGARAIESYKTDKVCIAVRKVVRSGVVVVAAAGNNGKNAAGQKIYGGIHSPGIDPSVITVGASNSLGTEKRDDDTMTTFSSRGPTRAFSTSLLGVKTYDNLAKPDLVAPGNKIIAARAKDSVLAQNSGLAFNNGSSNDDTRVMYMSGTSMSTPLVTGTIALMLQANPRLTPNMIKMILQYSAQKLPNANSLEQGAGQLNVEGAVRLAKAIRTSLPISVTPGTAMLVNNVLPKQSGENVAELSKVGGTRFNWASRIISGRSSITGSTLYSKYQGIYNLDNAFGLGKIGNNGLLLVDDGLLSGDGLLLVDDGLLLVDDGVVVSDGLLLVDDGLLLVDDGLLLVDDGLLLVDDGTISSEAFPAANTILGDNTAAMQ